VDQSPMLTRYVRQRLATELARIPDALVLPLGMAVEGCLRILIVNNQLDESRCLFGFPHPSGANGHRRSSSAATRTHLDPASRAGLPKRYKGRPAGPHNCSVGLVLSVAGSDPAPSADAPVLGEVSSAPAVELALAFA
jgi:hypothetical protein